MSLDFSLYGPEEEEEECVCTNCDNKHSFSRVPKRYWGNITHNLGTMADKAGIYDALWRPKEHGYSRASDIIPILEKGLADLKSRPRYFKKFEASNGWGIYIHFVPFVEEVLNACKEYPTALIESDV